MAQTAPRRPPAAAGVGLTAYLLVIPAAAAGSIATLAATRSLGWALVAGLIAATALTMGTIAWSIHLITDDDVDPPARYADPTLVAAQAVGEKRHRATDKPQQAV